MPHYLPHTTTIVVTKKELYACGLSDRYLRTSITRQGKGAVHVWVNSFENGKRVFHYEFLRDNYKTLIKTIFCNGTEPEIWLKSQETDKVQAKLDQLTDELTKLVITNTEEIKELMETQSYTSTECHQLARAAAWLRLLNEYDVRKARQIGFSSVNDFRNELFKRCLNEQKIQPTPLIRFKKGNITNLRVLLRNADDYKREGIRSLMHAGIGNVNREKADTLCHAKLLELASDQRKFSWEDVAMFFNGWAVENNKPKLTVSSIKQHLNTPKIKKVWFYARHGKLAGDNELQSLINREKPSFPDALWSIDGTTMALYYKDENGKMISDMYAYFVTDAHTGSILGASIAYVETADMVSEALIKAINTYENKPYQIQYDNSSANQAHIVQSLMSNMTRVHFGCEPYKGRSKYVESIIGHYQQQVLRKMKNFKGGNVDVKSLDSMANPELLSTLKKNPDMLRTRDEVIEDFYHCIDDWNARGEERNSYGEFIGPSKIARYNSIQHEKRQKLNYFDRISLFMVELKNPYPYSTQGICIELYGKEYKFKVPDSDNVGDFIFSNEHLMQKFKVRINRQYPELCSLYENGKNGKFVANAYELEKLPSCAADMKEGDKARQVAFKAKQEQFGVEYSKTVLMQQMEKLEELQSTGTDGLGWWDRPKAKENAIQNKKEDVRNGIDDGYTEMERKLMEIGN